MGILRDKVGKASTLFAKVKEVEVVTPEEPQVPEIVEVPEEKVVDTKKEGMPIGVIISTPPPSTSGKGIKLSGLVSGKRMKKSG